MSRHGSTLVQGSEALSARGLGAAADLALDLETGLGQTPSGIVENPHFFSGIVARPEIAAAGILAVADVASTRYIDLAALAASRDPVVTASGDRLRFESFSGCNGVYARFDLLNDGISSGQIAFGTTNVDINMPLRVALAALPRHELMHLAVGSEHLTMSTPDETLDEAKVELPERWVRGFAEVPTVLAGMSLIGEVSGTQAMTFVAGLPKGTPGPTVGVAPGPRGLRITAAGARGSATLAGTARLTSLRRMMRHLRRLSVWAHESGASAWVAEVDGGRVTFTLTPQAFRGFSGEGQLLAAMAESSGSGPALRLLEQLAWEPAIDNAALAAETGLSSAEVAAGVAELAASGKVGFDLSEQTYFHRELPFDAEATQKHHPRLNAARKLVEAGAVTATDEGFRVGDETSAHWVKVDDAGQGRCTCRWYTRYQGGRGPCSHLLAVSIHSGDDASGED